MENYKNALTPLVNEMYKLLEEEYQNIGKFFPPKKRTLKDKIKIKFKCLLIGIGEKLQYWGER